MRPLLRAALTMAVPVLGFLLTGCGDEIVDPRAAPWLALVGPAALAGAIWLGITVDLWRRGRSR